MLSDDLPSFLMRSNVDSLTTHKQACQSACSCHINENHLSTVTFDTTNVKHSNKDQNIVSLILSCISGLELHSPRFDIAQNVNADVLDLT